jgi:hypothetical protein
LHIKRTVLLYKLTFSLSSIPSASFPSPPLPPCQTRFPTK